MSASGWMSDRMKLRASAGHTFRIPTFTELYYTDPNHQGAGALAPETAWSADAGADLFARSWTAAATVFARREDNVIDWVRPTVLVRWRTANVRDVQTRGLEASLERRWKADPRAGIRYTWIGSRAPALDVALKYLLDYARDSIAGSAHGGLKNLQLGSEAAWKHRVDGRSYWTADAQVGRSVRRAEIYVQVSNVFDEQYQEIRDVDMPGRWVRLGVRFR